MARRIAHPAARSAINRNVSVPRLRKRPASMAYGPKARPARPRHEDCSLRMRPLGSAIILQWVILLGLSALFGSILELLHLPAALLLGPMIAAILLATANGTVRIPSGFFFLAQGVLGCLIARSVPLSIFAEIGRH